MKLTPSSTASSTSRAASSSVLPVFSPIREKPPVPSPATLTRRPVRPRVVYCMGGFLFEIGSKAKLDGFRCGDSRLFFACKFNILKPRVRSVRHLRAIYPAQKEIDERDRDPPSAQNCDDFKHGAGLTRASARNP